MWSAEAAPPLSYSRDSKGGVASALHNPEAMLFPEGEAQNHWSVGVGLAWPRFQIDAAYDSSKHYKVGSLSFVTRF
jgi:hypothetical protein